MLAADRIHQGQTPVQPFEKGNGQKSAGHGQRQAAGRKRLKEI